MRDNVLFKLKNIRWQNIEDGELVLTERTLGIYPKRGFLMLLLALFGRRPSPAFEVDISRISAVETDSLGHLVIEGTGEGDEVFSVAVMLADEGRLEDVVRILRDALAEVLATREQEQREIEAIRERNRRQYAETQTVLMAAKQVWEGVSAFRWMVMALRDEDWEVVQASFDQVARLMAGTKLSLDERLIFSLAEAIEAKSSGEVHGAVLVLLRSLAVNLEAAAEAPGESDGPSADFALSPGWCHLPYFLLFALGYMEIMLCHDVGDDETVEENLPRLQQLVPVLQEKFGLDVEKDIYEISKALGNLDFPRIQKTSREMESHLGDRMKQWGYHS